MSKRRPAKRHTVQLWRPSGALDAKGQLDPSNDIQVAEEIPCSIDPLRGTELDVARRNFASASLQVRLYESTKWNMAVGDYLVTVPGGRRLEILEIIHDEDIQLEAILTVGEEVPS